MARNASEAIDADATDVQIHESVFTPRIPGAIPP